MRPIPLRRPSDPIPPREHHRRALRVVVVAFVLVVLGGLVYVGYSLSFLWSGSHDGPAPEADGATRAVRAFFEVDDDGEARVEADLEVALGRVTAGRAEAGTLFQAEVDVTAQGLRPRFEHVTRGATAEVALSLDGGGEVPVGGLRSSRGNAWRLYFSERALLDLDLSLGATEAELDFTGIPVEQLALDCGVAKATLRFTAPNPVVMEQMEISAGLSEFAAHGLGFARFEHFEFDGGAGDFTLDFTGEGLQDGARADVSVGMASLTVLLPAGAPVILDAPASFMTQVHVPPSFVRLDDERWRTPGATAGEHRAFHLDIDAGPGNVDVRLVE